MPLVSAKCTNCGANLEVDNIKEAAICPYCGMAYIVEKAVNNYNTTNNITAEVVNVYGGNTVDFVIRAGELVKYNGSATEVIIPDSVTIIGEKAFENCRGLTSVLIPDSVTTIGSYIFAGCNNLKSITIPSSVTSFSFGSFGMCNSLSNIVIADGTTSIAAYAFSACTGLQNIIIPNSVISIGDLAFFNCESLSSIVIPDSVTSIGNRAFSYCLGLRSIVIPNSVTSIGNETFSYCRSLSITIPDSVTSIGQNVFFYSNNVHINASNQFINLHRSSLKTKKEGCYIATAVYGSYDCPSVRTLRRYRDYTLSKSFLGRLFIRCYYAVSPIIVRIFGKQKWFNHFCKKKLDRIVSQLNAAGYNDSPYNDC